AENIMDCWHVDLIGPLSEVNKDGKRIHLPSLQGKIYILVIVDEYSRYVMVEPIQQKSDATESIISYIKQQQNATRLVLKRLHSDGGSEFNNKYY
ncbi:MAG: integrase catalytic domain-containing protein, partial [Nitrososphaeraceae archaeon]